MSPFWKEAVQCGSSLGSRCLSVGNQAASVQAPTSVESPRQSQDCYVLELGLIVTATVGEGDRCKELSTNAGWVGRDRDTQGRKGAGEEVWSPVMNSLDPMLLFEVFCDILWTTAQKQKTKWFFLWLWISSSCSGLLILSGGGNKEIRGETLTFQAKVLH